MSKLAKSDVRYHLAGPDEDHCAECKWWLRPISCQWVKGSISPEGWCRLYHAGQAKRRTTGARADVDREYVKKMRAST